jgi:hypothetical protein
MSRDLMKGCPTDKLKFETPILITVFSGRRRDIGHARSALESIHTRDHCPLGQCHYPLSSLKIWELQERRELPLLLGLADILCFRTRWRWQWSSPQCARSASLLCSLSSLPWRKVFQRKRLRKDCSRFRPAPKAIAAIIRSAQREMKSGQGRTHRFGSFGVSAIPTR